MAMQRPRSPSLRRRRLSTELRRIRSEAGQTTAQAAKSLQWAAGKLSMIENAETQSIKAPDLDKLLDLYQVDDSDVREAMHQLAGDAKERGWWSKYKDIFGARALPDFEAEASVICTYEAQMMPGLLQTPRYTEALLQGGRVSRPEEVKRKVEARMARRDVLTRFKPARLRAVIDEAALRRVIGSPEIMGEQLEHLLHMAQSPNIDIQILPFNIGSHAALAAPFTVLHFPDPLDLAIVYVETVTDGLFLEEFEEVELYSSTFGDIQGSALSAAESASFVCDSLASLERSQQ